MKKILFVSVCTMIFAAASAQAPAGKGKTPDKSAKMTPDMTDLWAPIPKIIDPGYSDVVLPTPSDAIILFGKDGKMNEWQQAENGGPCAWSSEKGVMTVAPGKGSIVTKRKFNDFQLHIEWRSPTPPTGDSQGRGNSGVFLHGLYEVQVLDSYNNETYVNGQAGAVYKQSAPLVNPCRKPGEWNTYDIIFTAPRFKDDGGVLYPARVTVIFNGVVVQNNTTILGPTLNVGVPAYGEAYKGGPLLLQDHKNPVSYRNIWIREL